jgi:hypothetical protein
VHGAHSVYFPLSGGWRMQELAASAKYLSPVVHESEMDGKGRRRMAPDAANPGRDGRGGAHSRRAAGRWRSRGQHGSDPVGGIETEVSSVPEDVKGFGWYVEKVTVPPAAHHGVMQGVVWAIPKGDVRDSRGSSHQKPRDDVHTGGWRVAVAGEVVARACPRRRVCRRAGVLGAGPEPVRRIAAVAAGPVERRWGDRPICTGRPEAAG